MATPTDLGQSSRQASASIHPSIHPAAAAAAVSTGVNELAGSTLYNSLIWLSPGREILGVHRKLMPTGAERLIWGYGTARPCVCSTHRSGSSVG